MVDMIDVSNYDGNIDWTGVKNSGVQASYSHAFEFGPNTQSFPANWSGMLQNGLQRGAYCFGRPAVYSGQDSANQLVNYVTGLGFEGSDFFVLDAEVPMTADWAVNFLSTVVDRGFPVALYASTSFLYDNFNNDPRLHTYPLIVADYGPNDGNIHPISRDLSEWKLWAHQYTSVGSVPGVPTRVDCNQFVNVDNNPSGVDMTPEEHAWLQSIATGVAAYGLEAAHVAATNADYNIRGTGNVAADQGMQHKLDLLLARPPAGTCTIDQATIDSMATAIAQAVGAAVATAVVNEIKGLTWKAE